MVPVIFAFHKVRLFAGQGCRILEQLANILSLKVRIFPEDILYGHSVGNNIDDERYRDPHSAYAGYFWAIRGKIDPWYTIAVPRKEDLKGPLQS